MKHPPKCNVDTSAVEFTPHLCSPLKCKSSIPPASLLKTPAPRSTGAAHVAPMCKPAGYAFTRSMFRYRYIRGRGIFGYQGLYQAIPSIGQAQSWRANTRDRRNVARAAVVEGSASGEADFVVRAHLSNHSFCFCIGAKLVSTARAIGCHVREYSDRYPKTDYVREG